MLESQLLRDNPKFVATQLLKRGFNFDVDSFVALEEKRKALQVATQALQNERNVRSKAIGEAKSRGEDIEAMRDEVNGISEKLEHNKLQLDSLLLQIDAIALAIKNAEEGKGLISQLNLMMNWAKL